MWFGCVLIPALWPGICICIMAGPLSPLARAFQPGSADPPTDPPTDPRDQDPPSTVAGAASGALDSTLSGLKSEIVALIRAELGNVRTEFASSEYPPPPSGELKFSDLGKAKLGELPRVVGDSAQAGTSGTTRDGLSASKEFFGQLESLISNSSKTKQFENADYLDVFDWCSLIDDGFRILPHPGHSQPYRFSIEQDETYKRIFDKFKDKIKNPVDNGSLQEYHFMFCSTFYLSCSVAALSAACAEGFRDLTDDYVGISRQQADIFCNVTKTLAEVESQARARFASIRIKHDPCQDPTFQRVVAEEVNQPDLTHQGSEMLLRKAREYLLLRSAAITKEGAKAGASALFGGDKSNKRGKNKDEKLKTKQEKGSKSET